MTAQELVSTQCNSILGWPGRMISGSKSLYRNAHPENFVIFNSNIACSEGKVWYGDIDLTLDKEKLIEIAKFTEETLYVLYEMDGRFENEERPLLEKAAVTFFPDGSYEIKESLIPYYKL